MTNPRAQHRQEPTPIQTALVQPVPRVLELEILHRRNRRIERVDCARENYKRCGSEETRDVVL